MKTKFTLCIMAAMLMCGLTAWAKPYVSPQLASMVENYNNAKRAAAASGKPIPQQSGDYMLLLARGEASALDAYTVSSVGDVRVIRVTLSELAELSQSDDVERIEGNKSTAKRLNDKARERMGVDKAEAGNVSSQAPQAFDGKGVLVGVIDDGIEYIHPTYRSTADGRLRLVRAWDLNAQGNGKVNEGNFPIGKFYSDSTSILNAVRSDYTTETFHGTHTSGIAAGSGWGSVYRGMAPEADIYTASLNPYFENLEESEAQKVSYDAITLLEMLNMCNYADSVGKPLVVNYSAGDMLSIIGQHNLLDAAHSTLFADTPGRIFVAAAGNSGLRAATELHLDAEEGAYGGGILDSNENYGRLCISATKPLKLTFLSWVHPKYSTSYILDVVPDSTGGVYGNYAKGKTVTHKYTGKTLFGSETLTVYITAGDDEYNSGRVGYDVTMEATANSLFSWAVIVEQLTANDVPEGQQFAGVGDVNVLTSGLSIMEINVEMETDTLVLNGFSTGCNLDYPAVLPSVLTVGAVSNRKSYPRWNEDSQAYEDYELGGWYAAPDPGTIANFSSIGPSKVPGAVQKPEVVAPGQNVVSSSSEINHEKHSATTQWDGHTEYYTCNSGTSMSCPAVAGTIALWMQAKPTLTLSEAIEVIKQTSKHHEDVASWPDIKYGYGEIDTYGGLLYLLGLTGVNDISRTQATHCKVSASNGNIALQWDEATTRATRVSLYTTSGALVGNHVVPAGTSTYSFSAGGQQGIVCVQVDADGSTLVRL